jgi:hypothetical protein
MCLISWWMLFNKIIQKSSLLLDFVQDHSSRTSRGGSRLISWDWVPLGRKYSDVVKKRYTYILKADTIAVYSFPLMIP